MRESSRRRWPAAVAAGAALSLLAASPALAADTVPPVLGTAAFAAAPDGNANWRITVPQTLNLSATDDVAVSKLQYSLDGGANYIDSTITSGASVTSAVADSLQGNNTLRYRAIDSSGNYSRGTANGTTLNVGFRRRRRPGSGSRARPTASWARRSGSTRARMRSRPTIASISSRAASPAPNVTLVAPLANAHAANAAVASTYNTITSQIDTNGPTAIWGTSATTLGAAATSGRHRASGSRASPAVTSATRCSSTAARTRRP